MRPLTLTVVVLGVVALAASAHAQGVVYSEGFENGLGGWTQGPDTPTVPGDTGPVPCRGEWLVVPATDYCAPWALPFPGGTRTIRFGAGPGLCTYDVGIDVPDSSLISAAPIALPPASFGTLTLRFWTKSLTENMEPYDRRFVYLSANGGAQWTLLADLTDSNWLQKSYDITSFAGQNVLLKFKFAGKDSSQNNFPGWYLDDVRIEHSGPSSASYCAGDGSAAACPCGNFGAAGHGCANSAFPQGALLTQSGVASLSADTLEMTVTNVHNGGGCKVFQGTAMQSGGLGAPFGDGLRCAAGNVARMVTHLPVGNTYRYPDPGFGDTPISVRGAVLAPGMRYYQGWYRSANPTFCLPSETFNLSNARAVLWQP